MESDGCPNGPMTIEELKAYPKLGNARRWIDSLSAANWVQLEAEQAKPRIGIKEQLGIRALPAPEGILADLAAAQRRLYDLLEPGGMPPPSPRDTGLPQGSS